MGDRMTPKNRRLIWFVAACLVLRVVSAALRILFVTGPAAVRPTPYSAAGWAVVAVTLVWFGLAVIWWVWVGMLGGLILQDEDQRKIVFAAALPYAVTNIWWGMGDMSGPVGWMLQIGWILGSSYLAYGVAGFFMNLKRTLHEPAEAGL